VAAALEAILASDAFSRVKRPSRFLRHLVETKLQGQEFMLKESLIGVHVFERDASWDPRVDPVVRQEAARLRKRLARYYETSAPAVRIELPVGTYVPVFTRLPGAPDAEQSSAAAAAAEPLPEVAAAAGRPDGASARNSLSRKWPWAGGVLALALAAAALSIYDRLPTPLRRAGPPAAPVASASERSLAHDLCLKGRYEWSQRTPASLNRALDYFTQSVVHDPGYAPSYVGLADTYNLLREYSTMPEDEAYSRAIAAARKAVELDDSIAAAHRALAFAETFGKWDFEVGEKEFRRAIQLDPRDPIARMWYANAFARPGHFEECLSEIEKAQELDPASHSILADKGNLLYFMGRTQEAIDLLRQVERADPSFRSPHYYLMRIGFTTRDYALYLSEGAKAAQTRNDTLLRETIAAARLGYLRAGPGGLLQNLYMVQKQQISAGQLTSSALAPTCLAMGRKSEALQLLEHNYARHNGKCLWCLADPDLRSLKDEPRFLALVRNVR
jgi:tetratricopeptide (TPR) repeat protein